MARKTTTEERPPMSTGVGESRTFGAPAGTFDDDLQNPRHMANCTINGQPVPEHLWHQIPYEMTDQGTAEFNIGKEPARVKITRDEVHSQIGRRGEDLDRGKLSIALDGPVTGAILERGIQPFDASDPMRELVLEHVPEGMRPKFLSQRKINAEGTTRGYTICRDDRGNPVTLGTSVLGYIPEERARAIQSHFEEKSAEAQREMYGDDFDPRTTGRQREHVINRHPKQEGDLSSSLKGGSHESFENPDPQGSAFGLQGESGEDFQL